MKKERTCIGGNSPPIARTMLLYIRDQNDIFFRSPRSFLDSLFITTRRPSHLCFLLRLFYQNCKEVYWQELMCMYVSNIWDCKKYLGLKLGYIEEVKWGKEKEKEKGGRWLTWDGIELNRIEKEERKKRRGMNE